ncbi:MAG: ROK family protein, partial [Clostridia bacterium]|nr:ROK family protein [Clostridia bacterium]
ARSLFLVTVGTGIGSAVIIDGRLHRGATGRGAEFGHWKVADEPPCSCGNSGCLEMLASGRAMVRQVQEAISKGQKTSLSGLASISAKQIIDEARRGDELASRVLAQATRYLGRALGNIIVVLEPQKILIGGGVAEAGEIFFRPVREEIERTSFPYFNQTEVSCTALGNRAGIIGAAGLALGKVG